MTDHSFVYQWEAHCSDIYKAFDILEVELVDVAQSSAMPIAASVCEAVNLVRYVHGLRELYLSQARFAHA